MKVRNLSGRFRAAAWIFCASIASPLPADPVPNGYEGFSTQRNTDAWDVYLTDWYTHERRAIAGTRIAGENPYLSASAAGVASSYRHLAFVAGDRVASGAFTGDFATPRITHIGCQIYLENPLDVTTLDCYLITDAPNGIRAYAASSKLVSSHFGNEPGWHTAEWQLVNHYWGYGDFDDPDSDEIWVGDRLLLTIREIAFVFHAKTGKVIASSVGIDNIVTFSYPESPPLAAARTGGNLALSFPRESGFFYRIEEWAPGSDPAWLPLEDATDIFGTGPFEVRRPLSGPRRFFRLVTEPAYTALVTP